MSPNRAVATQVEEALRRVPVGSAVSCRVGPTFSSRDRVGALRGVLCSSMAQSAFLCASSSAMMMAAISARRSSLISCPSMTERFKRKA